LTGIAPNDWLAMYRIDNVQFPAGTYTITFDIKADEARDVRVVIEQAGLPDNMAFQHVEATTEWSEVTLTFVFEEGQFNKTFAFFLGSLTTSRAGSSYDAEDDVLTTIYLRNFEVDYEAPEA